jgi:hypothetical protein
MAWVGVAGTVARSLSFRIPRISKASSIAADDDVVRFSGAESGGISGVTFVRARLVSGALRGWG